MKDHKELWYENIKLEQEIKQLKEEQSELMEDLGRIHAQRDIINHKLEKIELWQQTYDYPTKDGYREQEFNELKEILRGNEGVKENDS